MRKAGALARVRQPGDHREVLAELLKELQVRRGRVIPTGLLREEVVRMKSQRRADAEHAPRRLPGRGGEGFQPGQCERNAGGADEGAASKAHGKEIAWRGCLVDPAKEDLFE